MPHSCVCHVLHLTLSRLHSTKSQAVAARSCCGIRKVSMHGPFLEQNVRHSNYWINLHHFSWYLSCPNFFRLEEPNVTMILSTMVKESHLGLTRTNVPQMVVPFAIRSQLMLTTLLSTRGQLTIIPIRRKTPFSGQMPAALSW
jgi:hypothetical protein